MFAKCPSLSSLPRRLSSVRCPSVCPLRLAQSFTIGADFPLNSFAAKAPAARNQFQNLIFMRDIHPTQPAAAKRDISIGPSVYCTYWSFELLVIQTVKQDSLALVHTTIIDVIRKTPRRKGERPIQPSRLTLIWARRRPPLPAPRPAGVSARRSRSRS